MFVHVTQVLPEGKTQRIEVNTDLLEDVQPWQGNHMMLIMQSGHEIEIAETQAEWDKLTANS